MAVVVVVLVLVAATASTTVFLDVAVGFLCSDLEFGSQLPLLVLSISVPEKCGLLTIIYVLLLSKFRENG